jgi:demethylmenaquinone methyltransferase/2-methoxy-6-polyprenyl-1,4-benzoquinol methylase
MIHCFLRYPGLILQDQQNVLEMRLNLTKAAFFDTQVAEKWAAAEYSPVETAKIHRMLDLAHIAYGNKVIEPGCGTGRLTEILSKSVGPHGSILSMDLSPGMIHDCTRKTWSFQNVKVVCSSVEDFSFEENGFDLVICHNVFPHFDDKPRAVRNLARALKPSGKFIVFHFMNSDWINDLHRKTHPCILNDLIPTPNAMEEIFHAEGFRIEHLSDDEKGYLLCAIFSK